jgi:hypothetical protein
VCPLSFHLACAGLKALPRDDLWLCPECTLAFGLNASKRGSKVFEGSCAGPVCTAIFGGPFAGPRARCERPLEEARAILKELRDHAFAPNFMHPVNPAAAKDYTRVVKRPMDYGTIQQKLREGSYGGGAGGGAFDGARFAGDLRLVTYNARIYNEVGSTLWRMADVLHRATETALRDRLRLPAEQAAQLAEATAAEQAAPVPRWPDVKQ